MNLSPATQLAPTFFVPVEELWLVPRFFFWLRCCNLRKKARGVLLIRLISPSGHGTNELRGEGKEGGELSLCKNILFFPSFLKPREEFLFTTLKVLSKSCLKGVPFFFSCFSSCKIKYLFIINYTVFFYGIN